jgi:hypothetical protein
MGISSTGFQEHINHAGPLLQRLAQVAAATIASSNDIAQRNGLTR